MNKLCSVLVILIPVCVFLSCKHPNPPVAIYELTVDNTLAEDTIDHALSYTFEVTSSLSTEKEVGAWKLQLLKKDLTYLTVVEEENSRAFTIPAGSLIEKIPTNQLFIYDGMRIKGRLLFTGNDIQLERTFTVWGKPAISVFEIKSMEENGYPDEMNVIFDFDYDGATSITIRYENEFYREYINFMITQGAYHESFNDIDMNTLNEFQLIVTNFLGTTYSEKIYIGGK